MRVGRETAVRRWLLPLLASPLFLLLSACPPPVSTALATAVSDKMAPTITVTSPTVLTYQGTMHFAGTITDDASSTGDRKGQVRSVEYTVSNDNTGQRQSRLLIDSNGATTVDTSFGSGSVITWNAATHSYAFDVSTVTPFVIPGFLQVSITATDENDNAQKQVVSLVSSTGPSITITQPTSSFQYSLGGGTVLTLSGTVFDAPGATTATNIKTITWGVQTKTWGAAINVPSGTLSVSNGLFSLANFTFNPGNGAFSAQIQIPSVTDATLTVQVAATDFNGNSPQPQTVSINAIGANAPQVLIQNPPPLPAVGYYSSAAFAPIAVSGIIAVSDIANLSALTYYTQYGSTSSPTVPLVPSDGTAGHTFSLNSATGQFSFTISPADSTSLQNHAGPAKIVMIATGSNLLQSNPSVTIQDDPVAPTLTATLGSSNTNTSGASLYAKAGDTVQISYTAADSGGSGLNGDPGLSVMGFSVGNPAPTSPGTYSYSYTVQNTDSGTFQFQVATSDNAGNTASRAAISGGKNVILYGGPATLSAVSIASVTPPASNAQWAANNDNLRVTFTSPRDFSTTPPVVTIAGHSTTLSPAFSPTVHSYTATTTSGMNGSETEGPVSFSISFTDAAGNAATVGAVTDSSGVTYDKTPPVISNAQFATTPWMKVGTPAVTLTFDAADNLASAPLSAGTILVNGKDVTSTLAHVSGSTYSVTYTVPDTLHDVAQNAMPISIVMKDAAGNLNTPYTTVTGGTPGVDTTPPVVNITSAKPAFSPSTGWLTGASTPVTLTFTATDNLTTTLGQPTAGSILVNTVDVTATFASLGSNTYSVTYDPTKGGTDRAPGAIPISITVQDAAGNPSTTATTITANTLGIDTTAPVVSAVSFASSPWMNQSSAGVALNFTAVDALTAAPLPTPPAGSILVNGTDVTSTFVRVGTTGNNYKVTYTVPDTLHDVAQNAMPISIVVKDAAGNLSTPYTITPASTPGVDTVAPSINTTSSPPTFSPAAGNWLKQGATLTLTLTLDAPEVSLGAALAADVKINGKNSPVSYTSGASTATVTYTVGAGDNVAQNGISVSVKLTDAAGNASNVVTTVPGGTPGLDTTVPVVNITSAKPAFSPSTGWLTGASTPVTLTFTATDNLTTTLGQPSAGSILVNTVDVTNTFTHGSGNTYSVTYDPTKGGIDRAQGVIPISITVQDAAGNPSTAATTITANTLGIDTTPPTISSVAVSTSAPNANGWIGIGATVTLTITAGNLETGLTRANLTDITVNNKQTGTVTDNGDGTYTTTCTVASGDTDQTSTNSIPLSVVLTDPAGNASAPYAAPSPNAETGVPMLDANRPTISAMTFSTTSTIADTDAVTFSENVWGDASSTTAIGTSSITFVDTSHTSRTAIIQGVSQAVGSSSATLTLTWNTNPASNDPVKGTPAANAIYDQAGNAMLATATSTANAHSIGIVGALRQNLATGARTVSTLVSRLGSFPFFRPDPTASSQETAASAPGPGTRPIAMDTPVDSTVIRREQGVRSQFYQPLPQAGGTAAQEPAKEAKQKDQAVVTKDQAVVTAVSAGVPAPTAPAVAPAMASAAAAARPTPVTTPPVTTTPFPSASPTGTGLAQASSPDSTPWWWAVAVVAAVIGLAGAAAWTAARFVRGRPR